MRLALFVAAALLLAAAAHVILAGESATPRARKQLIRSNPEHMVWVNPRTNTYVTHGKGFGETAGGKFMTEADAKAAGYRLHKRVSPSSKIPSLP